MKSKKIVVVSSALMMVSALSGCGTSNSDSIIDNMISSMRDGFRLDADISLVGTPKNELYDNVYQNYDAKYIFQNKDFVATQVIIDSEEEDGSKYNVMNDLLKESEDGSGVFLDLSYDNVLSEIPAVDDSGATANFGLYYGNPFSYINASDFTKVDANTYTLSKEKGSFISSRLFGLIDDCFYALIDETTFKFNNGVLDTIELKPIDVDTSVQMGYEVVSVVINSSVTMKVSEIGSAKVNAPSVKEHKSYHDVLQTALDNVNKNYTLIVKENNVDMNLQTSTVTEENFESRFYYADDYILWRPGYVEESPEYDSSSDVVLKVNEDDSLTGYGYDVASNTWTTDALIANQLTTVNSLGVEVIRPIVSGVAAEVFDYNETEDTYHICSELVSYIGANCFIPLITVPEEFAGYGTDCYIKLENGAIKSITLEYYFNNDFRERTGTVELVFSEIGTTSLPSDVQVVSSTDAK